MNMAERTALPDNSYYASLVSTCVKLYVSGTYRQHTHDEWQGGPGGSQGDVGFGMGVPRSPSAPPKVPPK